MRNSASSISRGREIQNSPNRNSFFIGNRAEQRKSSGSNLAMSSPMRSQSPQSSSSSLSSPDAATQSATETAGSLLANRKKKENFFGKSKR